MTNDDSPKPEKEEREEQDKSPSGKFVPWFPGLGALIVFLILRACGVIGS